MTPALWPPSLPEVAFFRDQRGAVLAAEVVRLPEWLPFLVDPPDPLVADIRLALLERCERRLGLPGWLVLLPEEVTQDPARVVEEALKAWPRSPSYRVPAAPPEDYVVAGFQALCPPHPPCEPGLRARESLTEYLRERPGLLGRLGDEGRDGFNRLVQLEWASPEAFAADILKERIRDAGAGAQVDLGEFIAAAEVSGSVGDFAELAAERDALLGRLNPLRYFSDARDFDRAVAAAGAWVERYQRAYAAHYREVVQAACATLEEIAPAIGAARTLESLNAGSRPVGEDAVRRLNAAVEEIRLLPKTPEASEPRTGDVALGHMPRAYTEARLAAAAVHAALDIQRRRASSSPSIAR
jgi:hypothetical protein